MQVDARGGVRVRPDPDEPIEIQLMSERFLDIFEARDISTTGAGIFVPYRFEGCDLQSPSRAAWRKFCSTISIPPSLDSLTSASLLPRTLLAAALPLPLRCLLRRADDLAPLIGAPITLSGRRLRSAHYQT